MLLPQRYLGAPLLGTQRVRALSKMVARYGVLVGGTCRPCYATRNARYTYYAEVELAAQKTPSWTAIRLRPNARGSGLAQMKTCMGVTGNKRERHGRENTTQVPTVAVPDRRGNGGVPLKGGAKAMGMSIEFLVLLVGGLYWAFCCDMPELSGKIRK